LQKLRLKLFISLGKRDQISPQQKLKSDEAVILNRLDKAFCKSKLSDYEFIPSSSNFFYSIKQEHEIASLRTHSADLFE